MKKELIYFYPIFFSLRYNEEVNSHKITKIRLRNAERGIKQAEERNLQLQKEMEEFFK